MAHIAFLAYSMKEDLQKYLQTFPQTEEHYLIHEVFHEQVKDTHGLIIYDKRDGSMYISFRGTTSDRDMITDLECFLTPYEGLEGVQAHSGMYECVKAVKEYILDRVSQWRDFKDPISIHRSDADKIALKTSQRKLYITGHSLGGCLASLIAPVIYINTGIMPNVYSMGSCPSGNKPFMQLLRDCTEAQWNVVNHLDLVPILTTPLRIGYGQFHHIAFYDGRGQLLYLGGRKFDAQLANRLLQRLVGDNKGNQFLHHLMYLGLTARTANTSPLDRYVYSKPTPSTPTDDETHAFAGDDDSDTDDVEKIEESACKHDKESDECLAKEQQQEQNSVPSAPPLCQPNVQADHVFVWQNVVTEQVAIEDDEVSSSCSDDACHVSFE